MTDNAERWRNVAQAAQWLAEGREVEYRWRDPMNRRGGDPEWIECDKAPESPWGVTLRDACEYRLKPDPPKPREWTLSPVLVHGWPYLVAHEGSYDQGIRVREVIE